MVVRRVRHKRPICTEKRRIFTQKRGVHIPPRPICTSKRPTCTQKETDLEEVFIVARRVRHKRPASTQSSRIFTQNRSRFTEKRDVFAWKGMHLEVCCGPPHRSALCGPKETCIHSKKRYSHSKETYIQVATQKRHIFTLCGPPYIKISFLRIYFYFNRSTLDARIEVLSFENILLF